MRLLSIARLASFIFVLPVFAHATTVERLGLESLVKKAERIVVGEVSGSRTYWSDNGKVILTSYTIQVQETMKGTRSRTVELTTVGGRMGDVTLHVSGMPAFESGEQAVIFVENTGGFSTVLGLGQGKFSIRNGEISNSVADLVFPDGRPGKPLRMSLDSFKKEIKLLIDRLH
jgi:hypothetical protein